MFFRVASFNLEKFPHSSLDLSFKSLCLNVQKLAGKIVEEAGMQMFHYPGDHAQLVWRGLKMG